MPNDPTNPPQDSDDQQASADDKADAAVAVHKATAGDLTDKVTEMEAEKASEDEEALPPSTVHPAAPAGFTEADVEPDKGQFYIGMWGDKPNYGCPYCSYSSIEGSGDIELHILGKIDSGDIKHRDYVPSE